MSNIICMISQVETQQYDLLVVDDDIRLLILLSEYLKSQHFNLVTATNVQDAKYLMNTFIFDLLVLDVMMPGEDGLSYVKELRAAKNQIPILMLTAKGDVQDRILGLEEGADEYLPKPFDPKELVLRIQAILRRIKKDKKSSEISFGTLYFDFQKLTLRDQHNFISLTELEAKLLHFFLHHPNVPHSREILMLELHQQSLRAIDVLITRLRRKIEYNDQKFIQTLRNVGYTFWID